MKILLQDKNIVLANNSLIAIDDDTNIAENGNLLRVSAPLPKVYGISWDGSSTTKWNRTDDATDFADPVAAVNNGDGSSPFDNILPWSGMQIVDRMRNYGIYSQILL